MYYEEIIADGVLCYRTSPDAAFTKFTAKELTTRLIDLMDQTATQATHPLIGGRFKLVFG